MSDDLEKFTVQVEHIKDFEFKVRFDWPDVPELTLDEPEPLGHEQGPSASRLVAAAVGNCLAASLLFCLNKSRVMSSGLRAEVQSRLERNEKGRMRIGGMQVKIHISGVAEQAPRMRRCLDLFEDYCVVTASIRDGIPVSVEVLDENGTVLRESAEH